MICRNQNNTVKMNSCERLKEKIIDHNVLITSTLFELVNIILKRSVTLYNRLLYCIGYRLPLLY